MALTHRKGLMFTKTVEVTAAVVEAQKISNIFVGERLQERRI